MKSTFRKMMTQWLPNRLGIIPFRTLTFGNEEKLYRSLYNDESLKNRYFLNIGAGKFSHRYWTNLDYDTDWYPQKQKEGYINFNLFSTDKFPIEDETMEVVYSSHTVEHISDDAVRNMLKESYRVMKNEATIRLTMPNISLDYEAYKQNDRSFYYWIDRYSRENEMHRIGIRLPMSDVSISQIFLYHVAAQTSELHEINDGVVIGDDELSNDFMEMGFEETLNKCIRKVDLDIHKQYPGNHINWWTHEKAKTFLEEAGFTNIVTSGYSQSSLPILRNVAHFDSTHPRISCYIEAIKD